MWKVGPAAASAWLLVGLAGSVRFHDDDPNSELERPAVMSRSSVSFDFMTTDFTYQKRPSTFWGWAKRSFLSGRRQFSDVKDEISGGHYCNNVYDRDQTYYASSMCYWLPEIQGAFDGASPEAEGPGLKWVTPESGRQMCGAFTGSGQCMKCSVCHNNGRNKEGIAGWTAMQDVVELPAGCKKELEIESLSKQDHDDSNPTLMGELAVCDARESAYDAAVRALSANQQEQEALQARIDAIPGEIATTQARIDDLEPRIDPLGAAVWNARTFGLSACYHIRGEPFYSMLTDARIDAQTLLNTWPLQVCEPEREPWRCHRWECPGRWVDYDKLTQEYNECLGCKDAKQQTSDANNAFHDAEETLDRLRNALLGLPHERTTKRARLTDVQAEEQGLKDAVGVVEGDWFAIRENCMNWQPRYDASLAPWMRSHLVDYYDVSCEKACHEELSSTGCGVMEGVMMGEIWDSDTTGVNPGIAVECSPPYPSFFLAPQKYGAPPQSVAETCARLTSSPAQAPRRPQQVIEKAMMWKKERLFGRWRTRYFVLESGDDVRSAVLRYWTSDPHQPGAAERVDKAIILWDARSVVVETGSKYGLTSGGNCFRLKHFYRQYILCAPIGGSDGESFRDQWVSMIANEIKFPDAVPKIF